MGPQSPTSASPNTYYSILTSLLPPSTKHTFSSLPTSPTPPHISSNLISSLSLHPTLESALHLLNADLPSAHFLLRHMQSAPATEAMFLHGILHRIEGDYDNAWAWYGDVADSDVFRYAWPGEMGREDAMAFLGRVEGWRMGKKGERDQGVEEELRDTSLREIRRVLEFCEGKFGVGRVEDAKGAWVEMKGKHAEQMQGMVVGGEGWREF